jgi:hypothetical protein
VFVSGLTRALALVLLLAALVLLVTYFTIQVI